MMAPSSGNLLVPKAMRIVRFAFDKANAIIRSKLPASTNSVGNAVLQPIRIYTQAQSTHPFAQIRQSRFQQRSFSKTTHASRTAGQHHRASFPVSKTSRAVTRSGAAPFASTLRPNLTGGALPRSAGGYSLGGSGKQGVRHFSHTPSAQAQVVQNVSAGIRAFVIGGGKARYDGVDARTGAKKYKAITETEDQVLKKLSNKPASVLGSTLEFRLSPTITALGPSFPYTTSNTTSLNAFSLLDTLSTDFARALRDLSLTLADLRRLSSLGDLPITLTSDPNGPALNVRFPGCDAKIVENLCDEVGVKRGVVKEDEGWRGDKAAEMALLFPFADMEDSLSEDGDAYFEAAGAREPEGVDWRCMLSPSERPVTVRSEISSDMTSTELIPRGPILTPLDSPEGYESLRDSDFGSDDVPCYPLHHTTDLHPTRKQETVFRSQSSERHRSEGYEGLEGIYRFLRECEDARR